MDLRRLLAPLTARTGAPPTVPPRLDRLAEAWWSRTPRTRAVIVGALVAVGLVALGGQAARSPWGPPVRVPVAAADLPGGARLTPDAVRWVDHPAALVPDDVLEVPAGRLTGPAVAGTVLTERHVAADLTDLMATGEVAVAVPVDGLPMLAAGSRVDALAAGHDGTGRRLAVGARVLAHDGAWLWLAVPAEASAAVAAAGTTGSLSLAVRPPP